MQNIFEGYPDAVLYAAIIIPVLIYVYGVWKGTTEDMVVYRNFNDVMLVGLLFIVPLITMQAFYYISEIKDLHLPLLYAAITLESLFLLVIFFRTWKDNRGIFSTLLALYVKLPTGILFFALLFNIFGGKSRQKRRESVFWSIMLLPLLYALVKDKNTGFIPKSGGANRF
ncbi:MAG: hypothetical protein IBX55_21925 [Methyloprofundus sp.]|nr:hypothetical protein [Methyloprofundus sp.]